MKLIKSTTDYKRENVAKDNTRLYVFLDNTQRTSGTRIVKDYDGWYFKKYNLTEKQKIKYPCDSYGCIGGANIRGLENAYPITTSTKYTKKIDKLENVKELIDEDFETLKNACKEKNIDVIVFPKKWISYCFGLDVNKDVCEYIIKKEVELKEATI